MPSITVKQLRNFIPRKQERFSTLKSGIIFISKGSLSFRHSDGTDALLEAGNFTFYSSDQFVNIVTDKEDGEFSATCLDFSLDLCQRFVAETEASEFSHGPNKFIKFNQTDSEIYDLKETILNLASSPQKNDYALTQLGLGLLSLMVEQYPALLVTISSASRTTVAQKVIHYIEQNIEKNISLDTLSSYMGLSITTLKRRLSDENVSFSKLLIIKRIVHAATLLRVSTKTISQVALESGFKNTAHFTTAFKKYYGMTPTMFRSFVE